MIETLDPLQHVQVIPEAAAYYNAMAERGRLVYAHQAGTPWLLCTFFALHGLGEVPQYYNRKLWTTPKDAYAGKIIYVDKLVGRSVTRKLWRQMEDAISARVPTWHMAVWYRPTTGADRMHVYLRRQGWPRLIK